MSCQGLKDIELLLPNGFHDALLEAIDVNWALGSAIMTLRLSLGDPGAATEEGRNASKRAILHLSGLVYLVINAPAPGHHFFNNKALRIDGGEALYDVAETPQPQMTLPDDAVAYWFFVNEWNSFIHFAACSATLEWL